MGKKRCRSTAQALVLTDMFAPKGWKVGLRFDGAIMGAIGVPAPLGAMGMPAQAVPMGAMEIPAPSQVTMPLARQTVAEKLRDLKQLRDDGILSEWEFEQKKAQVLSLM